MTKPGTIDATQTREKTRTGEALLVCAYEREDLARELLLEGAMTFGELEDVLDEIERDREIVVYDAGPTDEVAGARALDLQARGYRNARVLEGGAIEWKKAGYPLAAETSPENPPPTAA